MFNQKMKSIRITKTDSPLMNGGESVDMNGKSSSSPSSKGLLSFNTSNFTKLFKNPTNFVQSTFGGGGGGGNSTVTGPFSGQSSSTSLEQSFTIPTYRKHHDASNINAVKKERDILSTPVLIAPAVTSSSTSSLVSSLSASSTPSVALGTSNYANISNGNVTAAFVQMRTSAGQNLLDQKIVKNNQFPSPKAALNSNNINRKSILSEAVTKTTTTIAPSISTATTTTKSHQNANTINPTSIPITATVAPFSIPNVVKTNSMPSTNDRSSISSSNGSILFETVKSCKAPAPATMSSLETITMAKTNSISPMKHERHKNQHECDDEKRTKCENMFRSKNCNANTNGTQAIASTSHSSSLTTKSSSIVSATLDNNDARQKAIFNSLMKNDLENCENENSMPNIGCNNNMDFNVQECIRYMESENPFEQSAMKLNYLQQMSMDATTAAAAATPSSMLNVYKSNGEAKSMSNIYENCISLPTQSSKQPNGDSNNYYQQDSNENLIALAKMAEKRLNDNSIDESIDDIQCNNNDSTNNNDNDDDGEATQDDCVQKLTSNSVTNSQQNILLSNYSQSFYLPRATELHDIQEDEDDEDVQNDDENAFINRYGDNWSMSKNPLYGVRGTNHYQPKISTSSFAAAASAMQSSRNPFLQLMTSPSGANNSDSDRDKCLLSLQRSPCTSAIASSLFDNSTVTSTPPTSNNNNNNINETCTVTFSVDETRKIFASLAAVANLFANVTSSVDGDASSICSSNIANDGSNSNLSMSATPELMNALQTLLKENGNEYITQFLQVKEN